MTETYREIYGTFTTVVTPENIERIREVEKMRKQHGWHGVDADEDDWESEDECPEHGDRVDQIMNRLARLREHADESTCEEPEAQDVSHADATRIGAEYVFAAVRSDDEIKSVEVPFLHIPGVHNSKLIREHCWTRYEAWDEKLFTTWAAIAGPFRVWLQVLDDSGQRELTASVTSEGIVIDEQFQPMCGLQYSIEGPLAVEVTSGNIEQIRALESRIRDKGLSPLHSAVDVQDINVGDTYRLLSEGDRESDDWISESVPHPICCHPDVIEFFDEHDPDGCFGEADELWDQELFDSWREIAGPVDIAIEVSSLNGDVQDGSVEIGIC